MTDTTALTVRRPSALVGGYQAPPDRSELATLIDMANYLAKAPGFVPEHFIGQPFKILAAFLYGRDLGITTTNALQHIIVIEGKAGADAQLIGMLVRRAGHDLKDVTTNERSTVTITRGDTGTVYEATFGAEDAQRITIRTKDGYKKLAEQPAYRNYPRGMYYSRALTECARKGCQDALMGVAYTPEELDPTGQVVVIQPPTGEIPLALASAATQEAVAQTTGVQASPSVVAPASPQQQPEGESPQGTGVETSPAPSPPEAAPATAQKRSARSVGPQAKRTNVVTVPQGAEKPATAPEVPAQATVTAEVVSSQPAPSALTDEPVAAEPVDEGRAVFVESLRTDLRLRAATLARLNAITRNHLVHSLKGEEPEEVPPATPSPSSDESLQNLIERDFPGRTLETLGEAELQNRLELIEPFISKRRETLKEKEIVEE
jgi:hypothetical protein